MPNCGSATGSTQSALSAIYAGAASQTPIAMPAAAPQADLEPEERDRREREQRREVGDFRRRGQRGGVAARENGLDDVGVDLAARHLVSARAARVGCEVQV
jgi:hypothetical protein